MSKFEDKIESITLIPSSGGRFEVAINNQLVYSKLQTGRFAQPGEVEELVKQKL